MAAGAVVVNISDMIDLAIGTPEVGMVDFNMLQTVLHCLAQQLRVLSKNVELRGSVAALPVGRDNAQTIAISEFVVDTSDQSKPAKSYEAPSRTTGLTPAEDTILVVERIKRMETGSHTPSYAPTMIQQQGGGGPQGPGQQSGAGGIPAQSTGTGKGATGTAVGVGGGTVTGAPPGYGGPERLSLVTQSKFNVLENMVADLQKTVYGSIPKNEDILQEVRSQTNMKAITDMWQSMNVSSRLEAAENGLGKISSLLQDLINETADMARETDPEKAAKLVAAANAAGQLAQAVGPGGMQGGQGAQGFAGAPGFQGAQGGGGFQGGPGVQGTQGGGGFQGGPGVQGAQGGGGFQGGPGVQGAQGGGGFQGAPGGQGAQGGPGGQGVQGGPGGQGGFGVQGGPGGPGVQGGPGGQGGGGAQGFAGGQGAGGAQGAAGGQGGPGMTGGYGVPSGGGAQSGGFIAGAPGAAPDLSDIYNTLDRIQYDLYELSNAFYATMNQMGVAVPAGDGYTNDGQMAGGPSGGGVEGGQYGGGGGGYDQGQAGGGGGGVGGGGGGVGGGGGGGAGGGVDTDGSGGGGGGGGAGRGQGAPGKPGYVGGPGGGGPGQPGSGGGVGGGGPGGGGYAGGPGGQGGGRPGGGGAGPYAKKFGSYGAESRNLTERLDDLEKRLKACCEDVNKYNGVMSDKINSVEDQVEAAVKQVTGVSTDLNAGKLSPDLIKDLQGLMQLFKTVQEMQAQLAQVHETALSLAAEKADRQYHINALLEQIELLKAIKMDREDMAEAMADKADLRALARKVSHDQFEMACDDLAKGLEHAIGKLNMQEALWQQALDDIQREIETKLDKMELSPVKDFFNSKLKQLQENLKQMAELRKEAEAAGTKRRLLRDVNCISCDAKAVMLMDAASGLPASKPLPANLSMKPYLSYELDAIRKAQATNMPQRNMHDWETIERMTNPKATRKVRSESDKHICNRYCGGSHTVTTPAQRVARLGHFMKQWGPDVLPLSSGLAAGDDGKMYKVTNVETANLGPGGTADQPCTPKQQPKKIEMLKAPARPLVISAECRCLEPAYSSATPLMSRDAAAAAGVVLLSTVIFDGAAPGSLIHPRS